MQTREKPPVVVHPDVEHLMKGDMLAIRETVIDVAASIADSHGIQIDRIVIRLHYYVEDDWGNVAFDVQISADDDAAFSYWEEVSDAITEARLEMPENTAHMLDDVGVLVYW